MVGGVKYIVFGFRFLLGLAGLVIIPLVWVAIPVIFVYGVYFFGKVLEERLLNYFTKDKN